MDEKTQRRFEALFRRGTEKLHQGETDRAVQLLERAYQIDAEHVDTAVNLSGAYILTKKFKKAVTILEPISEQHTNHAMVWTNLGAAYLGNPVLARDEEQLKAVAAFKRALEINPATPNAAYNIGLIYRDRGELETAVHWFQKAVQANPGDRDARSLIKRLNQQLTASN
ncbi:MAG: tetratricopeptide repeat protein [Chloroflexi bacterium]|nr:tetratricopeptide repeat protein [Chloroflexota bacterium]